ncbi:MAG: GntR family transcriptional regulator [Alphaproteobacteria bacterium HGW-Alphaproteobacteria-16]|nr:MAG: GntR family transcriptional regulator [Alphaproteobacteria bacterium HGW-Alphaproteobacteria-16]
MTSGKTNSEFEFFDRIALNGAGRPGPLYLQLQDAIRGSIENGELLPRATLPPEREISARLDISRITVRKAISGLVEEGLLVRQQGSGTYVAARIDKQFAMISSFTEDMAASGRHVTSKWLDRSSGRITTEEALAFGQSLGSKVFRFHRVRCADGEPLAIETTTVPDFALPSVKLVNTSLYVALEAHGHRPVRALQRLRAVSLDANQAELLDVEVQSPALYIERRGFNARGQMVELTKSWYRGDAYDFVSEINGS